MGWSANFLAALENLPVVPKWLLEMEEDYAGDLGRTFQIASHEPGYRKWISRVVSVGGGRIQPGSWRYTHGSWEIEVTGDITDLLDGVEKGNLARLKCGFEGWDLSRYQPVAQGALQDVRGVYPNYILTFQSTLTHYATRHDISTARLALFDSVDLDTANKPPVTTTIASKYNPADAILQVNSTSSLELGNSVGVVLVDNSTGGGSDEPFFLKYSGFGTTPTRLTGLSTADRFLTTQVCADVGSTVTHCAYVKDHPFSIAKRILKSTGDGTNGSGDVLPETWGLGISDDWIDDSDIADWKDIVGDKSGTDHDWDVVVMEGQVNAIGWLTELLAPAGIWIAIRQGSLTLRAAQNPDENSTLTYHPPLMSGIAIWDGDIEEVEGWSCWHPDVSTESVSTTLHFASQHSPYAAWPDSQVTLDILEGVATLPAITHSYRDFSEIIFDSSGDMANDIGFRCHSWDSRVPEWLKLRCRGLRLAQLCVGDLVTVTTSRVQGRMEHTIAGYAEAVAMITAIDAFWSDGYVTLELAIPMISE